LGGREKVKVSFHYDRDFVARWTVGFEDLRAAVAPYTPEKVSAITWLSPGQICESARCYGTTKPAVITWGFGLDKQGVNATQAARARCLLRALSGNLDVPGGELLGRADHIGKILGDDVMEFNEALPAGQRAKQLGADEYPFFGFPGWERNLAANRRLPSGYMPAPKADMTCMAHERAIFDAILTGRPYPVTAMISLASNPLLTLPNAQRTCQALKALDLYVVMDYYLTPSAALADYVFPAACTLERTELWLTPSFCLACPKGIGPLYERRDDYQFWRGLATRLGQADDWPWQTAEEVWDYRLAPAGLDFEELLARNGLFGHREYRRYERFGFGTPSGKVELRSDAVDRRMVDVQHGWWFPERSGADPELFGVFQSNANVLCPDAAKFCSPEIGSWPHTALLCRVEPEGIS
jgi:anaerobic selenocysteine-containing dehydrogenase